MSKPQRSLAKGARDSEFYDKALREKSVGGKMAVCSRLIELFKMKRMKRGHWDDECRW